MSRAPKKGPKRRIVSQDPKRPPGPEPSQSQDPEIRLNRFIANAGICSRREADKLIAEGRVSVNGKIVTELGTKVTASDQVLFDGKTLRSERQIYLLLNKPKDFITTMDDPEGRRIVTELIKNACPERIYPVGRLDRMTTGLLLFTNDGDLAKKLTHPKHKVPKIYQVDIDKPITIRDLDAIAAGVKLEDGIAIVDEISMVKGDKKKIGIKLHIGKNRIVRRIFEHLGYKVIRLDRVVYAGLTKKDLPRGKWRFLDKKEIIRLKHFN